MHPSFLLAHHKCLTILDCLSSFKIQNDFLVEVMLKFWQTAGRAKVQKCSVQKCQLIPRTNKKEPLIAQHSDQHLNPCILQHLST